MHGVKRVLAEQTVHQHEQPDGVALDAFLIVQNISGIKVADIITCVAANDFAYTLTE